MAVFAMRFDLRNPAFAGTSMTERYDAALDMCEWADRLGFVSIGISEHHGSEDGYLPSPIPFAAAMAARTRNARIGISALIAPFYDPLRLAEDLAVVDRISHGRLDITIANGYVGREFTMFGQKVAARARLTEEAVTTLRAAWTGEPFEYRGRRAQVTPTPHQPGGPKINLGGSSEAAARRAARIADGFSPSSPGLWDFYRDELVKLGKPDPGPAAAGPGTSFTHLATDVEAGWKAIGPHALHEMNSYGKWLAEAGVGVQGGYQPVSDLDALRATGQYRVITPGQMVAELTAAGPYGLALFHPLMGGIHPTVAWSALKLFETEVLPKLV